jgi:hypothetical protein
MLFFSLMESIISISGQTSDETLPVVFDMGSSVWWEGARVVDYCEGGYEMA